MSTLRKRATVAAGIRRQLYGGPITTNREATVMADLIPGEWAIVGYQYRGPGQMTWNIIMGEKDSAERDAFDAARLSREVLTTQRQEDERYVLLAKRVARRGAA